MYNALYAEFLKLRRHPATWLLVWLYPIIMGLLNVLLIAHDVFAAHSAAKAGLPAAAWIAQTAIILQLPLASQGRWLIAGFAAVAFAGEYSWNTWKLIIPARERWQLIVAKWLMVCALIYVAILAADVIMLGGEMVRAAIGGSTIPPGVTAQAVLAAHAQAVADIAFPIVYTVAWAGFLAVLTRSMLATAIASIVVISLEQAHAVLALLASGWAPRLTRMLVEALPLYHAANVTAHLEENPSRVVLLADGTYSSSWQISLTIVLGWIAALAVLTLISFRRQDMN